MTKKPTYYDIIHSKEFISWFGNWEKAYETAGLDFKHSAWRGVSKAVNDNGTPMRLFHGTTHEWTKYSRKLGNHENDMGIGFYATSDEGDAQQNYLSTGADLTSRISFLAEEYMDKHNVSLEEAKEAVAHKVKGKEEKVMQVFLKIKKPLIISVEGRGGTYFDFQYSYDEETEEHGDSKSLIKFKEAFDDVADDFDFSYNDKTRIWSDFMDNLGEPDYTSAYKVIQALKTCDNLMDATYDSDKGGNRTYEFVAQVFRKYGFDGVIYLDASKHFHGMGIGRGTQHLIAYKANQIKLADGTNVEFDSKNADIRFDDGGSLLYRGYSDWVGGEDTGRYYTPHKNHAENFGDKIKTMNLPEGTVVFDINNQEDFNKLLNKVGGEIIFDGNKSVLKSYNDFLNEGYDENNNAIYIIAEANNSWIVERYQKEISEMGYGVAKFLDGGEESYLFLKDQHLNERYGLGGYVESYEGIFNPKKTGVSALDGLLQDDGYNYFYKGVSGEVVMMSPDEYLKKVRTDITRTDKDEGIYDEKKELINEAIDKGNKINMPFLSLKEDGKAHKQEGRNRATIAKERGEKLIPVFIEKDISFNDKITKGKEYVKSAIKDGATNKQQVLDKLKEQGLHRDAIRFINENFDNKAVEQSLPTQPEAKKGEVGSGVGGDVEFTAKGGNKIVDDKGSPLKVYHGTFADFSDFDPQKLGSNTSTASAKEGFFFASNKKVAESYASDVNKKIAGLNKQAEEAKKQLKELTGDSPLGAGFKVFRKEYEKDVSDTVKKLLKKINAYDDYVAGLEDMPIAYSSNIARSGKLKEVHLNIKNPFIKDYKGEDFRDEKYSDVIKKAKEQGHDGVIFKNTYDGGDPVGNLEKTDIYVAFDKSQIKEKYLPTQEVKAKVVDSGVGGDVEFDSKNADIRFKDGGKLKGSKFYDESIDKYFVNQFNPSMNTNDILFKESEKYDDGLEELMEKLPTELIPLDKIVPTQEGFSFERLERIEALDDSEYALPLLVKIGDMYYVEDGHHRIIKNIKHKMEIEAKVFDTEQSLPQEVKDKVVGSGVGGDVEATAKALEGTEIQDSYISAVMKKNNEPLIKAIPTLLKPNNSTSSIAKNLRDMYMLMVTDDGSKSFNDPSEINLGSCLYFANDLSKLLTKNGIKNEVQDPYDGYHAWVYSEGKYYDAEAVNGVDNVNDFPCFVFIAQNEELPTQEVKEVVGSGVGGDEKLKSWNNYKIGDEISASELPNNTHGVDGNFKLQVIPIENTDFQIKRRTREDLLKSSDDVKGDSEWMDKIKANFDGKEREPIEVTISKDGVYHILDGSHRVTIAKELGRKSILAFVKEEQPSDIKEYVFKDVKAVEQSLPTQVSDNTVVVCDHLYKEHHETWDEIEEIEKNISATSCEEFSKEIVGMWNTELQAHFLDEENNFFPQIKNKKNSELISELIEEHREIVDLIERIKKLNEESDIRLFCSMIKSHIRKEEKLMGEITPDNYKNGGEPKYGWYDIDDKLKLLKSYVHILNNTNEDYVLEISYFKMLYNYLIIERMFYKDVVLAGKEINKNLHLEKLKSKKAVVDKFIELYDSEKSIVRFNVETLDNIDSVNKYIVQNNFKIFGKDNTGRYMDDKYEDGGAVEAIKKSNLSPELYKLVRTPEFKNWFGDFESAYKVAGLDFNNPVWSEVSKVVDENGEPRIVWHGTEKQFFYFDPALEGKNTGVKRGCGGTYFSSKKEVAETFVRKYKRDEYGFEVVDGYVLPCFLNFKQVKIIDLDGKNIVWADKKIESAKYENVIVKNTYDTIGDLPILSDIFITVDFLSIKLADGSNTTFDKYNPDIRFDEGGSVLDTYTNERIKKVYVSIRIKYESARAKDDKFWNKYEISSVSNIPFEQLKEHRLYGVLGVSTSNYNLSEWLVHRECLIVMPFDKFKELNDTEQVLYYDADYLTKNGCEAMFRLYDRKERGDSDYSGVLSNLFPKISYEFELESMAIQDRTESVNMYSVRDWFNIYQSGKFIDYISSQKRINSPIELAEMVIGYIESGQAKKDYPYIVLPTGLTVESIIEQIKKGIVHSGSIYVDESEWLIKNKELVIPENSQLFFVMKDYDNMQEEYDKLIGKYNLRKDYKISFVNQKNLNDLQSKRWRLKEVKWNSAFEKNKNDVDRRILKTLKNIQSEIIEGYIEKITSEISAEYGNENFKDDDGNEYGSNIFEVPSIISFFDSMMLRFIDIYDARVGEIVKTKNKYIFADIFNEFIRYLENIRDEEGEQETGIRDIYGNRVYKYNIIQKLLYLVRYEEVKKYGEKIKSQVGSDLYRYFKKEELAFKGGGEIS